MPIALEAALRNQISLVHQKPLKDASSTARLKLAEESCAFWVRRMLWAFGLGFPVEVAPQKLILKSRLETDKAPLFKTSLNCRPRFSDPAAEATEQQRQECA